MSESEIAKRMNLKTKCLIIASIVLLFFVLFIPLYQIGVSNTYEEMIRTSENSINELENKIRLLEGEIASAAMPEYLIDQVIEREITLESIEASSTVRIAKGY